jgi:putative redox protein
MAVEVNIEYQGKLRCQATHGPSRSTLVTDAPTDNHGKGEAFAPTDLVATALGSCLLTIMGIVAERDKIDMSGATAHVVKEMAPKPTRRIGKLTVKITFPEGRSLSEKDKTKLERAAAQCPVHASLHPDIELAVSFQ